MKSIYFIILVYYLFTTDPVIVKRIDVNCKCWNINLDVKDNNSFADRCFYIVCSYKLARTLYTLFYHFWTLFWNIRNSLKLFIVAIYFSHTIIT